MSDLPSGWVRTSLNQVTIHKSGNGKLIKGNQHSQEGPGLFPAFSASGQDVWVDAPEHRGDAVIISAVGARCGKAFMASGAWSAVANTHIVWPAASVVDPRWLWWRLNDENYWIKGGSAQPFVKVGATFEQETFLPPLAEQRRIVAKLDALTARTARARADLDRIPALADRYKYSVLAAAFSGQMTQQWRDGQSELPDANAIAGDVRNQRVRAAAGSKEPRRGPIADGDAGRVPVALGQMPVEWAAFDLEAITDPTRLIQYGILKPGDHQVDGVPYVKVMNIKGGRVELEKIRRTSPEIHAAYRRSSLRTGDLLLTIRGTVGRVAFVPSELDGGNITQDSVRIAVLETVDAKYVYWFLQSKAAQDYFDANQKGVAVRGINVGDVRPMEIPIPSKLEQAEIVGRIDRAMLEIDRLTNEAAAARRLIDRLDQAILAKAFLGELVAHDATDEPASNLLERIRAERASAPKAGRGRPRAA